MPSNLCCLCSARAGRFCQLCKHHLCTACSTHWAERGVAAFKELIGVETNLQCDHEKGERGGEDPDPA